MLLAGFSIQNIPNRIELISSARSFLHVTHRLAEVDKCNLLVDQKICSKIVKLAEQIKKGCCLYRFIHVEIHNQRINLKMGGCASKDKQDKVIEEDGTAGGIEGCVSNSMIFLAR